MLEGEKYLKCAVVKVNTQFALCIFVPYIVVHKFNFFLTKIYFQAFSVRVNAKRLTMKSFQSKHT